MDEIKRQKLEATGWKVGTVEEFLGLSTPETEPIELKLALSQRLKQLRANKQISQEELAKIMKSSQSRIAKIEAGDPSVSLDLIISAIFSGGATRQDIAEAITNIKLG
jgi:DNA-binding XRE family transcriptional regulator